LIWGCCHQGSCRLLPGSARPSFSAVRGVAREFSAAAARSGRWRRRFTLAHNGELRQAESHCA
jgi:hypothetical protein